MSIIYNPSSIPLRIPFSRWRNYNFIKPIRIIGSNIKLTDYQVKIELNSTNFSFEKCRADGADLRFVDTDGQSLDYWLESWSQSNKTGKVWCKIPEIPSRIDKQIWLIYGNSSANSEGSGTNTFEFFDDFNDEKRLSYKIFATDGLYAVSVPIAINAINRPTAIYVSSQNKTYIVYQQTDEDRRILYYDHATNTFSSTILIGGTKLTGGDTHGAPAITIDSSGYFYVFYGSHITTQYYKKSTNTYDIGSWGSEQTVTNSDPSTYPNPYFIDSTLHLLQRHKYGNTDFQLIHQTFNGSVWSSLTKLTNFDTSDCAIYPFSFVDSNDIIHAVWSWKKYTTGKRHNIYYMKSTDGGSTWTKADGTSLTIPVTESTAEKVYDSGANFCQIVVGDIQVDSTGKPLLLFISNQTYYLARWNGSSWNINSVVSVDNDFDSAALVLDSDSVFRAYITIGTGRGGELKEYKSEDSGVNWNYVKTIAEGTVGHAMSIYNQSSDDELEVIFCGGDDGNNAVAGWGKNCTYTSTINEGLDMNKWTECDLYSTASYSIVNGRLKITAINLARVGVYDSKSIVDSAIDVDVEITAFAATDLFWKTGILYTRRNTEFYQTALGNTNYDGKVRDSTDWGTVYDLSWRPSLDTIYKVTQIAFGTSLETLINDISKGNGTDSTLTSGYGGVGIHSATAYFDNYRIRKYASPEPQVIVL